MHLIKLPIPHREDDNFYLDKHMATLGWKIVGAETLWEEEDGGRSLCLAAIAVHRRINLFIALTSFPSFLKFIEFVAAPRQREMPPPTPMESYFERTIKQSGGANGGWYFAAALPCDRVKNFHYPSCVAAYTLSLWNFRVVFENFSTSRSWGTANIYLSKANLLNFYVSSPSNVFSMCAATGNAPRLSRREIN